jgi:hypothetical protein
MKSLVNYLSEEQAVQCVGKGWEHLVRRVYNAKEGMGIPVGIIQVKEKWGGLRIYTDYYVREIEEVITEVGRRSLEVCEQCGAPAGKELGIRPDARSIVVIGNPSNTNNTL